MDGDEVPAGAVQLGPFQRAALRFSSQNRMLTADVARSSGAAVYMAAMEVLRACSALNAELVDVPLMRVPWQRRARARGQAFPEEGHWEISSGATTVRIAERDGGCRLTVSAPPVFVDRASLVRFTHLVEQALEGVAVPGGPGRFAIEAGHLEMMRAGELDEDERYWRARRKETAGTGSRVVDVVAAPRPDGVKEARLSVDGTLREASAALATAAGGSLADIANFALAMVLDRLDVADMIERSVDARDLMGLAGAIGVFSHTVPGRPLIDPGRTLTENLRAAVGRWRREGEFAGCPSPRPEGDLPEIVFTADVPRMELPDGWTLAAYSEPLAGHVVFNCVNGEAGCDLVVRAADDRNVDPQILVRLWRTALGGLVASPDATSRTVGLADTALMTELSDATLRATGAPAPADLCRVLSSWAAEEPARQAIRWPGDVWSYAELLHRAQATAARLSPAAEGDIVAVVGGSNNPETIVGFLAVLWRGAAFMPLDPDEPAARISDALVRSGAVAVLSTVPGFTTETAVPIVSSSLAGDTHQAREEYPASVDRRSPAYVLRTSGSTGMPKLVAVSRASLDNYLSWVAGSLAPSLLAGRVLPALSPSIFDASFKQTLGMLLCGRTVWLPGADRRDPASLVAELSACSDAVAVNCVPSYWSALLEAIGDRAAPRVEQILLGGETVTRALLRRTRETFPTAQVWNLYGPTETTATATMGLLDEGNDIHVGRPIAGAVLAVLDRYGMPVPKGIVGEIAIAGPGVAIGYLGAQDGESPFISLPVHGDRVRAYRTGDYGWLAEDGALHLVGRRDTQVKVNGWRIELGEIESAAEQLAGVRRSLAAVDDEAILRLFVIGEMPAQEVRARLAALLPAPMLPATVHTVGEFPVLPNGKEDRAGLLAGVSRMEPEDPQVYDPEQLAVATAWRDLLRSGWPRVTDDFFEVGGHSLLLAQMVNRLRSQGFTQVSVRDVVRRPTVESVAALIRTGKAED